MSDSHKIVTTVEPRVLTATRMHPLVERATAHDVDPATLRELLAVQRDYEANEAKKSFTRALAALKRDLPTVIKRDKVVDFSTAKGRTHYTHTSLAQVMDVVTEPLTAHGFSLAWEPSIADRSVRVTCRLTHTDGHSTEATLEAPSDTSGNKSPAQAIASTVTLLQRYTALALLGIATADMVEPEAREEPVDPSTVVNVKRNLNAARRVVEHGRTREAAEKLVGRPVAQWTGADIDAIAAWVAKPTHDPSAGELSPEEEAAIGGAA